MQINIILGLPLDERIVNIGFRDGSRAEANPYKSGGSRIPFVRLTTTARVFTDTL